MKIASLEEKLKNAEKENQNLQEQIQESDNIQKALKETLKMTQDYRDTLKEQHSTLQFQSTDQQRLAAETNRKTTKKLSWHFVALCGHLIKMQPYVNS